MLAANAVAVDTFTSLDRDAFQEIVDTLLQLYDFVSHYASSRLTASSAI